MGMLSPIATELKHLAGSLTFLVVVVAANLAPKLQLFVLEFSTAMGRSFPLLKLKSQQRSLPS
jgi:hypothetical protein